MGRMTNLLLEKVRSLACRLEARLRELRRLPIVGDTRGAGFFWAVELVKDERDKNLRDDIVDRLGDVLHDAGATAAGHDVLGGQVVSEPVARA